MWMLLGCRVVVVSWACRWGWSPGSRGRCWGLSAAGGGGGGVAAGCAAGGCGGVEVVEGAVAAVVSAVAVVAECFACAESVAVVSDAAGRVVGRPARFVHPGDMDGAYAAGQGSGPFGAGT